MESGNKYDDDSTLVPLISEEEMDVVSSGHESDVEPMCWDILEVINDGIQSHPSINSREALYKICDWLKQSKAEWKVSLLSTLNMGRCLHKVFKAVVNDISQALQILG